MKKIVFFLGAFAILTSACNKSDMPTPHSTCSPCPDDDKTTDPSIRKPAKYTNTERRFGDTLRVRGIVESDPAKLPVVGQLK